MTRIAILRCGKLPGFVTWDIPNPDELFEEDKLLLNGFEEQGFQARSIVWNDTNVDWKEFDIALIRSTWDYLDERELFLRVLSQIEASSCRLFNPLAAVSWNIDKHYLFDLEKWGVPIIPTYQVSTIDISVLNKLFADRQWGETVILKPAVGLGGAYTYRFPLHELDNAVSIVKSSHPGQEFLIQPFIETIISEGEWSFIYFNRQLSHVLLKKPAHGDFRVQEIYGGTIQSVVPRPGDLLQAEAVINKLSFDILYARLDFVRVDGQLSIIEVELIEPVLSFKLVPQSIERLVNATRAKLGMRH